MNNRRVTLAGHLVPSLKNARQIGNIAPNQILHLSIGLTLRDRPVLDHLLKTQDDRTSPLFHHYLSPEQFAFRFGPLPTTTKQVSDFLSGQGFHIDSVSTNHALIVATAPANRVEQTFATHLATFAYQGRTVYAPITEPSVPVSFSDIIQAVVGLDNVAQWHHVHPTRSRLPQIPANKHPQDPGGCFPSGTYGYGPTDFYSAYDISPLVNYGYDGTGQYVAIVETDGDNPSDVTSFDQCFGLPTLSYQNVAAGGNTTTSTGIDEADLDMETIHEIAPGAQEIVYLGTDSDAGTTSVYDQIVNDTKYRPHIVSTSFGDCESAFPPTEIQQFDTILAQGASEGIAFFAASGDTGAYDCTNGSFGVDVPASDPHVVGVGGTQYVPNQQEVVWNNTAHMVSSGGGLSTNFATPAYQQHVYGSPPSSRGVPDVAADASNYAEYCSVGLPCLGWETSEGTSAAAPLWAGIAADINTYLSKQGKLTLGTASALLYQIAYNGTNIPIRDITSGCDYTNTYCASFGYDVVTGLGVPDAWSLASNLFSQIQTNIESEVVWGTTQGGTTDLIAASNRSDNPGWKLTNISQIIRRVTNNASLNLQSNTGQPAVVSYPTYGDGTEMDAFALASLNGNSVLYGFSYLAGSDTWADLGPVATSSVSYPLPVLNPVAVALNTPGASTVALFGISSNGHLWEYSEANSVRENGGNPTGFNPLDISAQRNLTCDPGIVPAAVVYNAVPVVFADCGGKLVEFYSNTPGTWFDNASLPGNSIPNASHAFPGHSLAAMVVPGNPASMEADVASDRNGVSALSEFLYDGSAWHANAIPLVSGYTPDQLHAQTVVATTSGPTPISEVIATNPASTSCSSLPLSVQYLYQPNNPSWHGTVLPSTHGRGVTGMTAIVEQSGTVLTEAFTGGYTGTATAGAAGGGGCASAGQPIYEDYSQLSSVNTQSWATPNGVDTGAVENAGIDPNGSAFPY